LAVIVVNFAPITPVVQGWQNRASVPQSAMSINHYGEEFTDEDVEMVLEHARTLLEVRFSERYRDHIVTRYRFLRDRSVPENDPWQNDPWLSEYLLGELADNKKRLNEMRQKHSQPESRAHRSEVARSWAIQIVSNFWTVNNIDNLILGQKLGIDEVFAEFARRYPEWVQDKS
jgi:hypothetical protein